MYEITNQTLTQTVDAIHDLDRRVSEIDTGLLWRAKDSDKLGGYTADHYAERVPAAIAGNLASLDASGNLADSGKKPGDFALLGEHGVLPYTHAKNGTIHSLIGPAGALIRFQATASFDDGDSWSLNGMPLNVTYQGGEALLPTAVLAGDTVMGVVDGDSLRLMLQKPVPQEPVPGFINGDLRVGHVVNQRAKDEYAAQTNWIYTIDGYHIQLPNYDNGTVSLTVNDGVILHSNSKDGGTILQKVKLVEAANTHIVFTVELGEMTGKWFSWCNIHAANGELLRAVQKFNIIKSGIYSLPVTVPENAAYAYFCIGYTLGQTGSHHVQILRMKPEFGNRFTGWPSANPSVELAKCLGRQIMLGPQDIRASYVNVNDITFFIPTPATLQRNPALSEGFVRVKSLNGAIQEGFTFTFTAVANGIQCTAVKAAHGLNDAMLYLNSALFDANL